MSYRENIEWNALTNGDLYLFVGFMAKNNWTISKSGHKYNYFTYDVIIYDLKTGRIHKQ
ncbi:hypothetical protein [Campylobacter sp. LR196d]|uniref:hypothetical protein n=1 Tax=Campylobacter sp. LR196d TaxID=2593543 RepID=UPI0016808358|nr:hypothetical protein [Campylobacter sp. LR196d]